MKAAAYPPPALNNNKFKLIRDYFWESSERNTALLMLGLSILLTIALALSASLFAICLTGFWASLTVMNSSLFLTSIAQVLTLTFCTIAVEVLYTYVTDSLAIRWRNWLTKRLIERYLSNTNSNNYVDLGRSSTIDNPQQRIQQNVRTFVEASLYLGLGLLSSVLKFCLFISALWVLGGAYLVFSAIGISVMASFITYKIGRNLTTVNKQQEKYEADFRSEMETLNTNFESIAQEHGETYYKASLESKLEHITLNSKIGLNLRSKINAFQSFYTQISSLLPYIVASPLYFMGRMDLSQLMQIGFSYNQVSGSLNWFVYSYEYLSRLQTSVNRITELENTLSNNTQDLTKEICLKQKENATEINVTDLNVSYPSSNKLILKQLTLHLKQGENTLFKGPSGLGKSTLFKVLAGTWKHGNGNLTIPHQNTMFFLTQKPTLPGNTLKAVLAYPNPDTNHYSDEDYKAVLKEVGHIDKLIDELDTHADWSSRLSPGEQQRISIARALLIKPKWLFLDEITASLDPVSERHMYTLLKNKLPNTTLISIAHRPSVTFFHDRIITFKGTDENGNIKLSEGVDDLVAANDSNLAEECVNSSNH